MLWLRCRKRRGSSRSAVRVRMSSRRRDRRGRVVQSRWVDGVCIGLGGSRQLGSLRTRVGALVAAIGSGDLAKLMGMRLAKALLIMQRNGTNIDGEMLCRWCVSAIQRTLEGGADSSRLLLALVWSRRGWENIEELLCRTCEENQLIAVLVKSCYFAMQLTAGSLHLHHGRPSISLPHSL